MPFKHPIYQELIKARVLPLFYHDDPDTSFEAIRVLYDEGIRIVEYTNRGRHALANFGVLRERAATELPGMQIGVGTIHTEAEAEMFLELGAKLLVSPLVDAGISRAASDNGAFWIPGCMTPTEIQAACNTHAPLVKIFPANLLGPTYIKSIREIFPGLQFMPTGGVTLEASNIHEWFNAGVSLIGLGSQLIDKNLLEECQWDILRQRIRLVQDILGQMADPERQR